ncbi:Fusaric acid resistance protein-like-domain-containing protein [Parasitella parasitica]|nr:Fusaric acid resistance protein-like-domain-containing protein [Parasitella parasitica]
MKRIHIISHLKDNKELWKKILKCTIAYEIGTIIILIPQINQTMTVPYLVTLGTLFYNASGTAGNQIVEMALNVLMMVPACIWCAVISYLCTLYNRRIEPANLYGNGAGAIASIAFFICVFIIAYFRLKYPRLFIPALQGFVIPFFGLTSGIYKQEFDVMSVVGIFYPTLIGGVIALLTNLLIWPETAAKVSENAFGSALASVQNVLESISSDIFQQENLAFTDLSASKKLRQHIQTLDADISKMQSSRTEAKYEIIVSRYCPTWYKEFAQTMSGLSRNLYGFSLAVEREGQIMLNQKIQAQLDSYRHSGNAEQQQQSLRLRRQQFEHGDTLMSQGSGYIAVGTDKIEGGGTVSRIEYKLISRLQSSIQPEIKQFVAICMSFMRAIRHRLAENDAIPPIHKLSEKEGICHSRDLTKAMESLQEAKIILQKQYEDRRAQPTEDHYLIYTLLFSLIQFGKKLIKLEEQADQLIKKRAGGRLPRIFLPRMNFVKWLGKANEDAHSGRNATEQVLFGQQNILQREETRKSTNAKSTRAEKSNNNNGESSKTPVNMGTFTANSRPSTSSGNSSSINIQKYMPHKPNGAVEKRMSMESDWIDDDQASLPLQNAPGTHVWNRWLHNINEWLRRDPTRYAIKFAVTMELLALMAWLPIDGINELYNNNRGQWALLSAMVVFNFTVGSTALQCLFRVLATIIGAVCGYICLLAADRNQYPYVLAIMVLIFQIPMWYALLGSRYPKIGFISLLTMAVIVSTGYADHFQEKLFDPVWKRTLTAIIAIIVVLVIDQLLWPVWARKMVRKHVSDLLIATGIQYSKVASLVCQANTSSYRYLHTLHDAQCNAKILRRQHQLCVQMLGLAQMEPRMTKGAFPIEIYRQILDHELNILYWIEHLLKVQTFITTRVRQLIMNPMNSYRKELAAAVHLYLFTLAGSLRTKSSLPASLPSAELARQMLQQRQAELWHDDFDKLNDMTPEEEKTVDLNQNEANLKRERGAENQIYWQTYAAGTVEVINEQEAMGELVAKLMGQHVFKAATKDWIA